MYNLANLMMRADGAVDRNAELRWHQSTVDTLDAKRDGAIQRLNRSIPQHHGQDIRTGAGQRCRGGQDLAVQALPSDDVYIVLFWPVADISVIRQHD